jgi:hypothetical protein
MAASIVSVKCSVPVVDVPYETLMRELAKPPSCQKVSVDSASPAIVGYEQQHAKWAAALQKPLTSTRCGNARFAAPKPEKDERCAKKAEAIILSCVHLQAIPDPGQPGRGIILNPFSRVAVEFGSNLSHPDIRPLFDTRKCISQCGAIKRGSSRGARGSRSRSRNRSARQIKPRSRSGSRGSARMKRRTGGSRVSSSRFSSHDACASMVPLGGDVFKKLVHAEGNRPTPLVRKDIVFMTRKGSVWGPVKDDARFLELGPMGRAAALLLGIDPADVYDETIIAAVCRAVFKCGPCPPKTTPDAAKSASLVTYFPHVGTASAIGSKLYSSIPAPAVTKEDGEELLANTVAAFRALSPSDKEAVKTMVLKDMQAEYPVVANGGTQASARRVPWASKPGEAAAELYEVVTNLFQKLINTNESIDVSDLPKDVTAATAFVDSLMIETAKVVVAKNTAETQKSNTFLDKISSAWQKFAPFAPIVGVVGLLALFGDKDRIKAFHDSDLGRIITYNQLMAYQRSVYN